MNKCTNNKKIKVELPYGAGMPLPGIYLKGC
jgi:hypothetical protein